MIHLKRLGVGLFVGLLVVTFFTVALFLCKYYPVEFFWILGIALIYTLGGMILSK